MSNEINVVQIQTALLIPVTAQFIEDKLGIKPVRNEKRAKFWTSEQFVDICQGLISHITSVRNVNFDQISGQRPKKVEEPAATTGDNFSFGGEPEGSGDGFDFGGEPEGSGDGFDFGGEEKPAEEGFFA